MDQLRPETGSKTADRSQIRRVTGASVIGTVMEWYDFFLYGTAAALVFNRLFFPEAGALGGVLASFATLGVGFLARPLGGVIFGHLGDRFGRKFTLVTTLLIMGLSTTLIGVLPTAAAIGVWAPVLLVFLRVVQGIAVGGEWGSAAAMIVESAPPRRRGYFGGWLQISGGVGTLLSTGAFSLVSLLPDDEFLAWGWRLPFLFSIVLAVAGLIMRRTLKETEVFQAARESAHKKSSPVIEVFKRHPKELLIAAGLRLPESVTYYMVTVFTLFYTESILGMDRQVALTSTLVVVSIAIVTLPFFGRLSDRVGRRPLYLGGAILSVFLPFIYFPMVETTSPFLVLLAFILIINTGRDLQYGPQPAYLAELFDDDVRTTGVNIAAQLGGVIGGGFAPFIATALYGWGGLMPVTIYVAAVCALGAIAAYFAPETAGRPFGSTSEPARTGEARRLATEGA
ncbi:MFS transporter [Georgenia daeguensis]|uniref:MFS transporter n=1 Tax=Georgenia daeguensis TaxID=908355 RepID=A0ABP8EXH8_9MICO